MSDFNHRRKTFLLLGDHNNILSNTDQPSLEIKIFQLFEILKFYLELLYERISPSNTKTNISVYLINICNAFIMLVYI